MTFNLLHSCFFYVLVYANICGQYAQVSAPESPLAAYSDEWNHPDFEECNTAVTENYLTQKEKEIIYILNLVRSYPQLFASTVLVKYPQLSGKRYLAMDKYYYQSLQNTLENLEQMPLLFANKLCYASANCHAQTSGAAGYTGHTRKTADCNSKKHFMGECCDYGNNDPLEIVLALLIDKGVPSLGHRLILLSDYDKIGVSVRAHKKYKYTAVLDFY
jgi:uncharacterized protein YkwD